MNSSYQLNYILYSPILFFCLFITIFVFIKNTKSRLNKAFSLLCFFISFWVFCLLIADTTRIQNVALFWCRLAIIGPVLIPPSFLAFSLLFIDRKREINWLKIYFPALFFIILAFTDWNVKKVFLESWGSDIVTGPLYIFLFLHFFIYSVITFYFLLNNYKKCTYLQRVQTAFFLIGYLFAIAIGVTTNLILVTIGISKFSVIGPFSTLFFLASTAYAILKHRFMDISIVLRKSLIYSITIILLSCIYAVIVFFLSLISIYIGQPFWVSILQIIVLVIISTPLQYYIKNIIDKLFFRYKYDYQKALKDMSEKINYIKKEEDLISILLSLIPTTLKIKNVFYEKDLKKIDSEILEDFYLNKKIFVKDLSENVSTKDDSEVMVPLFAGKKIAGVLKLKEKYSEEPYNKEDLQFITTVSNQASVALANIDANQKLIDSERIALMGEFAAKLAHEIKNPIAAMKTMNQLFPFRRNDRDYLDRLYDTFDRQLKRVNNMIVNLLKLGKPIKLNISKFDSQDFFNKLIDLVGSQCELQNININKKFGNKKVFINADKEQMFQLFLNIFQNSIQAMPNGGIISIEITNDINFKFDTLIIIKDTGCGISQEKLEKIFDPFYTTKSQGTGLGLSLVKKIIEEHNFEIKVESELSQGTKFMIFI